MNFLIASALDASSQGQALPVVTYSTSPRSVGLPNSQSYYKDAQQALALASSEWDKLK